MRILLLLVALLSASEWVLAQSRPRSDPADPSAAAPRPAYQPAFSDYQPFRDEPVRSWKEVNKEVADNPGMGSMKHGSGTTMPGMDSKAGNAAKAEGGTGGHDMGSMQQKAGASKSGMDSKTGDAAKGKGGAAGHDMGSMQQKPGASMPGMDKPAATAPKGKEGAAGHDMGAMKGMDKPAAAAPKSKGGAAGHDMGSMKDKPGAAMPGMDSKAGDAPKEKGGAASHDMSSMKDKPGKTMPGMDKPAASTPKNITGTGSVQLIDKANGKVKLTHDPIAAMGWPKMTLFFRLKEGSLADRVKEGDEVEFTLEKSASGYVISSFQKPASESNPAVDAPKPAGHGKH